MRTHLQCHSTYLRCTATHAAAHLWVGTTAHLDADISVSIFQLEVCRPISAGALQWEIIHTCKLEYGVYITVLGATSRHLASHYCKGRCTRSNAAVGRLDWPRSASSRGLTARLAHLEQSAQLGLAFSTGCHSAPWREPAVSDILLHTFVEEGVGQLRQHPAAESKVVVVKSQGWSCRARPSALDKVFRNSCIGRAASNLLLHPLYLGLVPLFHCDGYRSERRFSFSLGHGHTRHLSEARCDQRARVPVHRSATARYKCMTLDPTLLP